LGCGVQTSCNGHCRQYCNRAGGAPSCDTPGALCQTLPGGESVTWGYCQ
jgi:hypothetical protein